MRAPSSILTRPGRLDLLVAAGLTLAGELEVLLGPAGGGSRTVSAVALPVATLALAWRRPAPLPALAVITLVLLAQVPAGGFLLERPVAPLVAAVLALYSAGRYLAGAKALGGAAAAIAALAAARIAFDPSVTGPAEAALTLVYVPLPLLVGRWVRGQVLLQRELEEKGRRLERERERTMRQAAEDERMRIAGDLQAAVTDGLDAIVREVRELPERLSAQDHAQAHALLGSIAGRAREALADVRRVLGILRHEGPPRLAPGAARALDAAVADGAPRTPADVPPARASGPVAAPPAAAPELAAAAPDIPAAAPDLSRPAAARPVAARARRAALALGARERLPSRWVDRGLVAGLLVGAEIELMAVLSGEDRLLGALSAVAIVLPLLWRRRRPVPVAAAVLAAIVVQSAVLGPESFPTFDIAALVCAAFSVGAHAERRQALAGLALVAAGAGLHAAAFHPDGIAPALLGGAAVPWIVGRTLRGQRDLTGELDEKAIRMQRAREQESRAAMTAERVRVARELHDAVAHNISVIAIQAAGADGIVERDPERAAQCAALIEAVAHEALSELGRLLGPLSGDSAAPQPSLARVDALAQRARDGGLPVDLRVEGAPGRLPAGVDLAAFRIVQEALANTSKHAGASRAWVVVRYEERALLVEVGDDGRAANGGRAARGGSGQGLRGMRERVALYGGTLDAGQRPGGGFLVHARLPLGGT